MFNDVQELLKWIANGLSLVLERNRLSAAVVRRNQELATIRQIGSALASSTFDISKVLKYTMDMIREVMNVEAGSLLFLEDNELEIAVAFNIKIKSMKKFRLKLGQGIAGYVAARGEAIVVNDTEKSSHFFPVIDGVSGFTTRSALCDPRRLDRRGPHLSCTGIGLSDITGPRHSTVVARARSPRRAGQVSRS